MRKENIWKRRKALSAFPPSVDWEFSAKKLFPTFFPFLVLLRGESVSRWPRSGLHVSSHHVDRLRLTMTMKKRMRIIISSSTSWLVLLTIHIITIALIYIHISNMITWCRAWQRRREEQRGRRWGRKGSRSPTRWGRSRQRGSPGQDCDDCHQYTISLTIAVMYIHMVRIVRIMVMIVINMPSLSPPRLSWTCWRVRGGWWWGDRCGSRCRLLVRGNSTKRRRRKILSEEMMAMMTMNMNILIFNL